MESRIAYNPLVAAERLGLLLAVAVVVVSGLAWGPRGLLSALVGAGLACVNLSLVRRLLGRALLSARDGRGDSAGRSLLVALVIKMPILVALIWVAVGILGLELIPLALGLSILVIALVSSGLLAGLKESA